MNASISLRPFTETGPRVSRMNGSRRSRNALEFDGPADLTNVRVSTLPEMQDLPGGVVTFLCTDVEGSTHAWEKSPTLMAEALVQHDEVINSAVTAHNGIPVKARGECDSWFVVFEHALEAVAGAADMQRRLSEVEWVTTPGLAVRASLHTGTADLRMGDYYRPVVNSG